MSREEKLLSGKKLRMAFDGKKRTIQGGHLLTDFPGREEEVRTPAPQSKNYKGGRSKM